MFRFYGKKLEVVEEKEVKAVIDKVERAQKMLNELLDVLKSVSGNLKDANEEQNKHIQNLLTSVEGLFRNELIAVKNIEMEESKREEIFEKLRTICPHCHKPDVKKAA